MNKNLVPFLTAADCDEIARTLDQKFASLMAQRYFEVEARRDGQGVYAKVTLRSKTGSFYYPVEGRLAHLDHDLDERAAGVFLLDYISEYFGEYFREDGELYLPIDWSPYEWDGVPLQLKGQVLNLEVERLADALLAGEDLPRGNELH